jgi:hypothetical protein
MKSLHAIALVLCASAPSAWIATAVLLLVAHGGSVEPWAPDDWTVMTAVLVLPLPLAAGLLRVPAPRRRTSAPRGC